jgi:uncharacterized protein YndB with AHSA1/START domain
MTPQTGQTRHDAFTLTRRLDASPHQVFGLFADTELWRKWFRMPGSGASYEHDFRVGGGDRARSTFTQPDGSTEQLENGAIYFHLEPDRRIVYAYESIVANLPRWASLVTVELSPDEDGTALSWTEQIAFITPTGDGSADLPHLRGAIQLRLNGLAAALSH